MPSPESRQRLLSGLLLGAAAIVPLVFSIAVDDVFSTPKLWVLWIILAVVIVMGVSDAVRGWRPWSGGVRAVDRWVLGFVTLSAVSFMFSVDRIQSWWGERLQHQGFATLLLYVGYYFVARALLADQIRLMALTRTIGIGASIVAGYALLQRVGLDPIWNELRDGRVFSTIGQPNALGAYLAMTIPLGLAAGFAAETRRARLGWSIAVAVQALALALTISRGAYLAVTISVLVFGACVSRGLNWTDTRILTAAATATAVAIVGLIGLVSTRTTDTEGSSSAQLHLDSWRVAGEIIKDHPLVGTGPDTYALVFPTYRDEVLPPDRAQEFARYRPESPHNVYLAIASGSGLPTLAAYLTLITLWYRSAGTTIRSGSREQRVLAGGVAAAVTAHLIANSFMTAEVTGTWLFWILLGSTVSAAK